LQHRGAAKRAIIAGSSPFIQKDESRQHVAAILA